MKITFKIFFIIFAIKSAYIFSMDLITLYSMETDVEDQVISESKEAIEAKELGENLVYAASSGNFEAVKSAIWMRADINHVQDSNTALICNLGGCAWRI